MAKKIRRILAILLVLCVFASAMPLQALAAEEETDTQTTTTTEGGLTTETTTTTTTTTDEEGNVAVVVEIKQTETAGTDSEGAAVESTETTTTTTVFDSEGNAVSENWIVEGTEKKQETVAPEDVTVDIPLTPEDSEETETVENQNTVTVGDPVGTEEVVGDVMDGEDDTEYDYASTTVETQGSVTVTTTEVTVTEKIDTENTDLDYVKSETAPDETNDLVYASDHASEEYLPGYTGETVIPEGVDGYDYTIVGSGNTSKFVPAIVFTEPLTTEGKLAKFGEDAYIGKTARSYYVGCLKEEDRARIAYDENGNYVTDENGFILDVDGNRILKEERTTAGPNGEILYMHRFDNFGSTFNVEGWHEDGEWVKELNGSDKYATVWAGPQQFVLVDSKGNVITAYCADNATPTQDVFGYNVENLEDATYYSEEDAKQIRSIALNGYWGTVGYETDDDGNVAVDEQGNPVPKMGSLEAMKTKLLASGEFTAAELESLNDGVALTATQMAIWSCSNKMSGIEFVNSFYSNWGVGDVPKEKEDEVKVLFKLYSYLTALEPTDVSNTTADTIINADNFLKDMSVTVIESADSHENNKDNDNTNDAYVVNLSFALVVTPSTDNGDDMIVKVIDKHGNVLATGRVAGEAAEGEEILAPDSEGNYSFIGITVTEGEQIFNITLEGIQNLDEGVYLYTSEVRDGTSSQTMVGVASGERAVNVSMNISFDLSVEEEVVVTEHVWHYEGGNEINPLVEKEEIPEEEVPEEEVPEEEVPEEEVPEEEIPEEAVPSSNVPDDDDNDYRFRLARAGEELVVIPDEEVPLADAPETSDVTPLLIAMIVLSGFGLVALNLSDKKRNHTNF